MKIIRAMRVAEARAREGEPREGEIPNGARKEDGASSRHEFAGDGERCIGEIKERERREKSE